MKRLITVLLFMPCMAYAEFESGNTLLAKLTSTEIYERLNGMGYVAGVFDSHKTLTHCAPDNSGITAGQITDIAVAYLRNRPAVRNMSADVLLREAFKQVWPCPVKNNSGRAA